MIGDAAHWIMGVDGAAAVSLSCCDTNSRCAQSPNLYKDVRLELHIPGKDGVGSAEALFNAPSLHQSAKQPGPPFAFRVNFVSKVPGANIAV